MRIKSKNLFLLSIILLALVGCKKTTVTTNDDKKSVTTAEHLVSVVEQNFDKNNPKDISFDISNVSKISLDGNELSNANVTIDTNKIIIKKEYLSGLNDDYYNFELEGSEKKYVRVYVKGSDIDSFESIGFYNNKDYRDLMEYIISMFQQKIVKWV